MINRLQEQVRLDGYAFAKGWVITVATWLIGGFIWAWWSDSTRVEEPNTAYIDSLPLWPIFAVVSVGVAALLGAPLAFLLVCLLRSVRPQWVHVVAFFVVFTTVTAVVFSIVSPAGGTLPFLGLGSLLGICAAAGRAAIIPNATILRKREGPE